MLSTMLLGDDIADVNASAQYWLQKLRDEMAGLGESRVIHVGYSKRLGRPCGYTYDGADGFNSVEMPMNGGHTMMPAPWTEHPDYKWLGALWTPAAAGVRTEEFHTALAINQHAAYRAGKLRIGSGIGGQVHTARVDRDGIQLRVAHEFPEYRHQWTELRREISAGQM